MRYTPREGKNQAPIQTCVTQELSSFPKHLRNFSFLSENDSPLPSLSSEFVVAFVVIKAEMAMCLC